MELQFLRPSSRVKILRFNEQLASTLSAGFRYYRKGPGYRGAARLTKGTSTSDLEKAIGELLAMITDLAKEGEIDLAKVDKHCNAYLEQIAKDSQ